MSFQIPWTPEAAAQFQELQQAASAALLISADVTSFGRAGDMPTVEGGEWRFHHHLSHL
jgi:hypothetical protein